MGLAPKVEDRRERAECGKSGKEFGIGGNSRQRERRRILRRLGHGTFWIDSRLVSLHLVVSPNMLNNVTSLGHILTRVVSKGATALGILHEYDLECKVLRSLLAQRVWRRGKRGWVTYARRRYNS